LRHTYVLYRCARCGSASTGGARRPDLYEIGVYGAASPRLSPLVDAVRRVYERQKLALIKRRLAPPARLLEVGAGEGRFVAAARDAGYEAYGLEPSARAVELAARAGVELTRSSLETALVGAGEFDGIVLWHVLEHLESPTEALGRVAAWLSPGGLLLLGVPNLASVQATIGGGRWLHLDVPRHRHHFTPAGLRALLPRCGFSIESEHQMLLEHNPFGMWQAWVDRVTSTPSYAYNLVKRNAAPTFRDLAPAAALLLAFPLAVLAEAVACSMGRGGTMAVIARRR
jgi:2-polyprenyl-3-methyl-5-hydroxy-6-metoxy-1,4-benzoquinol methylase